MEFRPDVNGLVDSNPFRSCLLLRERTCGRWLTAQEIFEIEFEFGDSVVNNYWYCEQDSTVANYYREFVDWKRWAASYFDEEDSDEVVVRIFVRGLQDSIRNQMPSSLPTSLSCAYWKAVAIELSLQLSSQLSIDMKKHFTKCLESNSSIKFDVLEGVDESTFQGSENSYSHLEKTVNEPRSGCELQPNASLMVVEHPEFGKVFDELPERNLPRKQNPEFSSLNDEVYANVIDAHRQVIVNERVDIVLKDFKYDSRKFVQDALIFHKWKDRGIVPHGCWLIAISVILSIQMAWFYYDWIVMIVEQNKELDAVPVHKLADIFVASFEISFEEQVSMLDSVDIKEHLSKPLSWLTGIYSQFE